MAKFNKTRRVKKVKKARRKTMKRTMRGGGGDCPGAQFCKNGTCHDFAGRSTTTPCSF